MPGLKDAVRALNQAVSDLTSLHVQTFTGTVQSTGVITGFDNVRAAVQEAQTNNNIQLIAEAYFQFDGDSYNFLASNLSEVPPSALELHKSAVEAGMKTRQGLMELVKDVFAG